MYDVIIIGAGPAGMAAALFCERQEMNFLLIEDPMRNAMITDAYVVENYPGVESIQGFELFQRMRNQIKSETKREKIIDIEKNDNFNVKTNKDEYITKSIIIATGSEHKKGNVDGEEEFLGRGVSYCVKCDGAFYKNKKVVVVGGGDSAVRGAISLSDIGAEKVYLVHRRDEFRAAKKYVDIAKQKNNIEFVLNSQIKKIGGKQKVEYVLLDNDNKIETDGVFFEIGVKPLSDLAEKIGVELENKAIKVDERKQTNVKGVFAAGDVTNTPLRQIITAASDGAIAADSAYRYVSENE